MPKPLALCLENLAATSEGRFTQCVAVVGRAKGLRISSDGHIDWEEDRDVACELCVSGDDRLILFRPAGAAAATLHRGGRSLELPFEKPVVALDQDILEVGERKLRIHIHGQTNVVTGPKPFVPPKRTGAKIAAAVALSAALASGCGPVEVRDHPPVIAVPEDPTLPDSGADGGPADGDVPSDGAVQPADTSAADGGPAPGQDGGITVGQDGGHDADDSIEVREMPPIVAPMEPES